MEITRKAIFWISAACLSITPNLLVANHPDHAVHEQIVSDDEDPDHLIANEHKSSKETEQRPPEAKPSPQPSELRPDSLVKIEFEKRRYWGRVLGWDGKQMALLGLDGQLNLLPVTSKSDFRISADKFQPLSRELMQVRLENEFGKRHQITPTKHFVVVHPFGDREIWAPPFEVLYERFRAYFEKHGLALREPEFPLVALVLRSRNEFDRYMNHNANYNRNVMGIYIIQSNRMATYDPKARLRTTERDKLWLFEYRTLIHELAHQAAFNTGVHNRFSPPARWVGEGLAMMFETQGINDSLVHTKQRDRVNQMRLQDLKQFYAKGQIDGKLQLLITDDRLFETEPTVANALAWGLTFYLSETFPDRYFEYLKKDASRKNFQPYLSPERLADFVNFFGTDLRRVESDLKTFLFKL